MGRRDKTRYKETHRCGGLSHSCDGVLKKKKMSTSWEYGDVSPARYPDLESKRKRRGAASSANHGGKKKKESKKKETVSPSSSSPTEVKGTIQQMVPVGLDALAKDHVVMEERDPLVFLEEYRQGKVTEEVLQEGVSVPPPTKDQETQTALQELIDEFVEAPPPPALPDYLVCPYHICHLENRVFQNGWHYAKYPMFSFVLFCAEEKTPAYMRAVHEQVHSEILKMLKHLLCFCCKPPTLQQSRSEKNPDRLYLCCSKKKCKFFQWAKFPLTRRYKDWLERETRESPVYLPTTSTRDADGYPLRGVDTVRYHPGVDPWVKKALKTKVPRPVTEYEKELMEEIRRLKEDATAPPRHDVPVPDRPLSEQERMRVEKVPQTKEGLFVDGRKVGWHNF